VGWDGFVSFSCHRVKSINASGHKYGGVYAGVGKAIVVVGEEVVTVVVVVVVGGGGGGGV